MKHQILFSKKNKKNNVNLSAAELAQRCVKVKIASVYVICCIFLQTFQTYFCIQANSVDLDQTAPKGAV